MHTLKLVRASFALALAISPLLARAQKTPEELTVRHAYARITYLSQSSVVTSHAIQSFAGNVVDSKTVKADLQAQVPVFELTGFHVGPISEIADQTWGSFVTSDAMLPSILEVSLGSQVLDSPESSRVSWDTASTRWITPDTAAYSGGGIQVMGWTVAHLLSVAGDKLTGTPATYTRYASYFVTATFAGKTIGPYKAMFLFGTTPSGKPVVAAEDLGVPGGALSETSTLTIYPKGLLRTRLRDIQFVHDWVQSTAIQDSSCVEGLHALCCTETACGVSEADRQKELSTPLIRPIASNK